MKKYLMVRSPEALITESKIGYGWKHINFSEHENTKSLIKEIIDKNGSIGRMKNQVINFFSLKEEDIVLVPVRKSVIIAKVLGGKFYECDFRSGHGANQIMVEYFKKDGKVIKIPRSRLKQNLESRLKLRTTIADLSKFAPEIDELLKNINIYGDFNITDVFQEKIENSIIAFKNELLKSLRKGNTRLKAGGRGLEELVQELLEIQGYSQVDILAKQNGIGKSDVDIQAVSENNPFLKDLLVQVKHHDGITGKKAIDQLITYEKEEAIDAYKWVITTGNISDDTKNYAEKHQISIMEGDEFVDWIYTNLDKLKISTKESLGIIEVPKLSWL
ncbi:restriction endonuclease [Acinetobacter pragensis]|uniref:Restriction endonuclease type IV Mrr domain-containing protein n=1 Tax=Acinetobacter pragensis TaxID=1806892 RepID=A0A151XXN6_9GAMM|nr:restriction endonuclease [Acinetobacter pragensis]KYQ70582.1 hypothetical protein AZH43_03695 [Acinetobacter pragensis]